MNGLKQTLNYASAFDYKLFVVVKTITLKVGMKQLIVSDVLIGIIFFMLVI